MPLFRDHVAVVVDDRVHADLRMTAEPLGDLAPAPPIAPPIWEFPMETRAPILVEDAFESCRQQAVATTGVHAPRTRHNNRRDRKSVVKGKSVSVRVDIGGRSINKK